MRIRECEFRQSEKAPPPSLIPKKFSAVGKENNEDIGDAKIAFLDQLRVTNRQWFDRMQSEADLASELASKLTAARSITEAMRACEQWTTRQFEVMAEDLANAQNLIETGVRLLSDGCDGRSA